ncbi:MAG TPA: pyridoxine 5'-phosphate synthase [Polyangiaceae bacterium]|jgi:pyridoxine 5-phosphate synthase
MTRLSVNLNKVATLRNARDRDVPSIVRCARIALDAGADGITVHPRPDARHIRPDDVGALAALLAAAGAEFNIEGNPFDGVVEHVERVRPTQATLVPDASTQTTSDHGWDLERDAARLAPVVRRLRNQGVRVSLFVDADARTVARAAEMGADRVELYTGPYAAAHARGEQAKVLPAFVAAAEEARACGVGVNAGHDLSLANVGDFLAAVPEVAEVSIGHALISDALDLGLAEAVRRYVLSLR